MRAPVPTPVHDSYWRFAAERLAVYYRRMTDPQGPWTADPILGAFRFTNVYRAADRVSQHLIREVQYGEGRPQSPDEVFHRTILFKLFNRIESWQAIERSLGPVTLRNAPPERVADVLDREFAAGRRIYSAAYIMPSPPFGHARKHRNHLALLARMLADGLPATLARAPSLRAAYEAILAYPGMGGFLAFQYAIDLNYSTLMDFAEADFVVAGPGALDGISKCFADLGGLDAEGVIRLVCDRQEEEFARRGLDFPGLYGRRLQPIDCQNLFCEISKYARVAHPEVAGIAGRTKIKQRYRADTSAAPAPFFPPKWNLRTGASTSAS